MTVSYTDEQRQSLVEILDQLIPANTSQGIPAAGQFGTDSYLLSATDENPQLGKSLQRILTLTNGKDITTDLMKMVELDLPVEFQLLLTETYKGYYSQAPARGALGLSPHPVHPVGYSVAAETPGFLEQLTGPVKERGECYRDTKKDKES